MRLLLFELWGLGDLTFTTPLLHRCREEKVKVLLVGKAHARELLSGTFPEIEFIEFDAPWTAFKGKYRLFSWPWHQLWKISQTIRTWKPDVAVSLRPDPRDHFWMRLLSVPKRIGVIRLGFPHLLTYPLNPAPLAHRVENGWMIESALFGQSHQRPPQLTPPKCDEKPSKPVRILLHAGARIPIRRWPEPHFRKILEQIKTNFEVHLTLIPDVDHYGSGLSNLANETISVTSVTALVKEIAKADLFLGNDSGPAHIAAAFGIPTITLFGPTQKEWFRPFGDQHLVLQRDLCPHRPCFDSCKFPEPYCLTRLTPEEVWPEIHTYIKNFGCEILKRDP